MPPTLAGLHSFHPVLVLAMQGDIRHISVGCGDDFTHIYSISCPTGRYMRGSSGSGVTTTGSILAIPTCSSLEQGPCTLCQRQSWPWARPTASAGEGGMLSFSSLLPAGKNSPGFLWMWCIYSVRGSEHCPSGSHLHFGEETASPCRVFMCSFHAGEAPALPTGSAQSRSQQWDPGEPVPAVGTVLSPAGVTHGMWETQRVPAAALSSCTARAKPAGWVVRSF